jgi:hypothetical protein
MKTKLVHKCLVYWDTEEKIWVVTDKKCGDFAENKNWRRAVYIGIYHFKFELGLAVSRALSEIR